MAESKRQAFIFVGGAALVYLLVKGALITGYLNPYWARILDNGLIVAIISLGLSIIYGFTGQFSIGHAAFAGLGAYAAGLIGKTYADAGLPIMFLALIFGAFVAGFIAYLIGLPVLRLRSDYLGIATLGFGIIVTVGFNNSDRIIPMLNGARGMFGIPQLATFDIIFIVFILTIILCRNFVHSSYGRAVTSIREDEVAANVVGINPFKYKMVAFVLGCTLAGLGGGLYAFRYPFLHPTSFDFLWSINYLLIVVLGGLGSLTGTIITSVGWVFLLEVLRLVLGEQFLDFRGVLYAIILIVTILVRRQGIFGGIEYGFLKPQVNREGVKRVAARS
ncbi:MAG: branched-chain amino acid ABC transporter permease [Bacillota bacterium]